MVTKAYKSSIPGIEEHTFNTGQNKFAAQFTQLRENVANFLQRMANDEGYLVAETVRTGKQQTIDLPPPIDGNDPNVDDLKIVHAVEVKSVVKHWLKLEESLKKGYATVYSQCAEEVRDKLKSSDDWERIQKTQSLPELIAKIEKICMGFVDHKQEVFNLMQSLKRCSCTRSPIRRQWKNTVAISEACGIPWRRSVDHPEYMRDWYWAS